MALRGGRMKVILTWKSNVKLGGVSGCKTDEYGRKISRKGMK